MQASNTPVANRYEDLIRRERLERTRTIGESLAPLFVAVFRAIDRVAETASHTLEPSAPDEEFLADARSFAELRQRFHQLDERRGHVAFEVGR